MIDERSFHLSVMRQAAWDMYASGVLAISHHPGTTRDKAVPLSEKEIAVIADIMLAERDKRFKENECA